MLFSCFIYQVELMIFHSFLCPLKLPSQPVRGPGRPTEALLAYAFVALTPDGGGLGLDDTSIPPADAVFIGITSISSAVSQFQTLCLLSFFCSPQVVAFAALI